MARPVTNDQPAASGDFATIHARLLPELEAIVAQYPVKRSALLPLAHRFQEEEGYVSSSALHAIARMLDVPLSIVESTVSFYTLFFRKPVGKYVVQVCRNLSCIINGAEPIMAHFRERLGIGHLQTTPDGLFSYEEVECLAACDRAPCMQVNLEFVYDLTPELVDQMLADLRAGTYEQTTALPQTQPPAHTWKVAYSEPRSHGAQAVSDPDSPGGIGDATGYAAAERLTDPAVAGRSRERLSKEAPPSPSSLSNGSH